MEPGKIRLVFDDRHDTGNCENISSYWRQGSIIGHRDDARGSRG